MALPYSARARDAIRGYRSEFLDNDTSANPVLDRLESDQNGKVSAALERFGAAYDPPLIH
jgi:hypothetical protein